VNKFFHSPELVEIDEKCEAGFATIQYVLATGLSLLLFVVLANVLVDFYARGVIRSALDEGVRAVVLVDADPKMCESKIREGIDALFRSRREGGVEIRCEIDNGEVFASADVELPSWIPGIVPSWNFRVSERAAREEKP